MVAQPAHHSRAASSHIIQHGQPPCTHTCLPHPKPPARSRTSALPNWHVTLPQIVPLNAVAFPIHPKPHAHAVCHPRSPDLMPLDHLTEYQLALLALFPTGIQPVARVHLSSLSHRHESHPQRFTSPLSVCLARLCYWLSEGEEAEAEAAASASSSRLAM